MNQLHTRFRTTNLLDLRRLRKQPLLTTTHFQRVRDFAVAIPIGRTIRLRGNHANRKRKSIVTFCEF
jgi:hypothetical protein